MKNNDLQLVLGIFEASYIRNFRVDLFNKKIILDITVYEVNKEENHKIIFQDVSVFYFSNGSGEQRFNTEKWDLMELSDIGYYKPSKDHINYINDTHGTLPHTSNPNFNLDIWGTVFLIEAKEVIIDDKVYQAI
jgi:hypothetical protein